MRKAFVIRTLLTLALISFLSGWPVPYRVQAAAGDLDPTFGDGGKVVTDFDGVFDVVRGLAIQPDGKIIAAGSVHSSLQSDFSLARYDTDGSLDSTFGDGGKVMTDFFGLQDYAFAVALQPDGRIVVAGSAEDSGSSSAIALARYQMDGNLDPTFGDEGRATIKLGARACAYSLALLPNGNILVAGDVSISGFLLARFNPDGSPDTSFGSLFGIQGVIRTQFNFGLWERALSLTLRNDGKFVVSGIVSNGLQGFDIALARYNADGSLDPSFGTDGKVTTDWTGASTSMPHKCKHLHASKIVEN